MYKRQGYADANNGKSMVSQLGELPAGSKVFYADFDYRLDGNQIVKSQSYELNRTDVETLSQAAELSKEVAVEQQPEVQPEQAINAAPAQPAKVEGVDNEVASAPAEQSEVAAVEKQPEQPAVLEKEAPGEIAQKGLEQEHSQQQAQSTNDVTAQPENNAKADALAMYEQAYGKAPEKDVAQPEVQADVNEDQSVETSSADVGEKETPTFESEEQAEAYASYEQAYSCLLYTSPSPRD